MQELYIYLFCCPCHQNTDPPLRLARKTNTSRFSSHSTSTFLHPLTSTSLQGTVRVLGASKQGQDKVWAEGMAVSDAAVSIEIATPFSPELEATKRAVESKEELRAVFPLPLLPVQLLYSPAGSSIQMNA